MLLTSAVMCLAANVFFEARSEKPEGQIAVAAVTLNRAGHIEDRVCPVVLKSKQFSWTQRYVAWRHGSPMIAQPAQVLGNGQEREAWLKAVQIAQVALAGRHIDRTGGATFYHATYVKPYWRRDVKKTVKIGSHIFYRQSKSAVTII